MSFTALALPNRTLTLAPGPIASQRGLWLSAIILLGLGIGLALWQGPGLWRDVQINQNPQVLRNVQTIDGECSTRRGLTDCEADLVYTYEGQRYEKHVSLAFIDLTSSDYEVEVVVLRGNPELATLSLGLDMLWNRLAVFSVFVLIFFGLPLGSLYNAARTRRINRALAVPARMSLVPVEIGAVNTDRKGTHVTYVDRLKGPKSARSTHTRFAKGQEPMIAIDETGKPAGVAVIAEGVAVPVLLDAGLERLDLSATEREAALAAFDAEQSARAAQIAPAEKPKRKLHILRGIVAGLAVIVFAALAVIGYWLYYVTAAPDAFDSAGMEINNLMPEPVNRWGCAQLQARFGDKRAPFGCTAKDFVSWRK